MSGRYYLIVVVLLTTHAVQLAWSAAIHSPAGDEIAYLPAGISHWTMGRFELYRANPPLVRMIAALPVMAVGYDSDYSELNDDDSSRAEFAVGADFLQANGERSFRLFFLARLAVIPFALLGGWVSLQWAHELYGGYAGLVALGLWCFCPNILGNGALITPDVATASLGLASAYTFWRWLKAPSWLATLAAGAVLGLAQLAKAFWIPLFVLFPVLWLLWREFLPPAERSVHGLSSLAKLATILLLALLAINAGYGFQGSFRPLKDYDFASFTLRGTDASGPRGSGNVIRGNKFRGTILESMPVPLPRQYLLGLDGQKKGAERGRHAYLFGEWKHRGWWYYYLCGALVKLPVGTLCLIALALVCRGLRVVPFSLRDELLVLAPAIAVGFLVSSQTGINRHFRYALPVLPFLYVWASALAGSNVSFKWPKLLAGGLVALSALSSLWVFPHSLSYFNELAGGPREGSRYLLGSNTDWGQDLLFLRKWIDNHPAARPLCVEWHFQHLDPALAGIDFPRPPRVPTPGWHVVGVNEIRDRDPRYRYFLDFEPVDRVAYSMNVYHLTEADIDAWQAARKARVETRQQGARPRNAESAP